MIFICATSATLQSCHFRKMATVRHFRLFSFALRSKAKLKGLLCQWPLVGTVHKLGGVRSGPKLWNFIFSRKSNSRNANVFGGCGYIKSWVWFLIWSTCYGWGSRKEGNQECSKLVKCAKGSNAASGKKGRNEAKGALTGPFIDENPSDFSNYFHLSLSYQ